MTHAKTAASSCLVWKSGCGRARRKAKNALRTCLQSRNCFVGAASPRRSLHFAGKNRLRASSTMHLYCLFCSSAFLCACLREVEHECSTSAGWFTLLTISYRRFAKRCKIRRCEKRRLGKTHQATLVTRTSIDFFISNLRESSFQHDHFLTRSCGPSMHCERSDGSSERGAIRHLHNVCRFPIAS